MSNNKQERINQWFVRGIALIVSSLLCTVLFFTFATFDQSQFYFESALSENNYSILARLIGQNLWGVRVFDLLIIFMIFLLSIISIYHLSNFRNISLPTNRDNRRYE